MREYQQLSILEREKIYVLHGQHQSCVAIARELGRSPSTVSREINRNKKHGVGYLPDYALKQARGRRRFKQKKLDNHPALKATILQLMRERRWSPAAIAGRLCNENMPATVCAETIYRFIYQSPKGIKHEYYKLLPRQKVRRQKRYGRKKRGGIPGRVSIHARPEIAGRAQETGHMEADLVVFPGMKQNLITASDIASKLLLIRLNPSKHSQSTINHLETAMQAMQLNPKTVTFDNGKEFTRHALLKEKGIDTYFCDPYSSWQKPRIEHNNGIIRRFLPRNIDPRCLNDETVQKVQDTINFTPRKSLNFKTPHEVHYNQKLKLIHQCTSS